MIFVNLEKPELSLPSQSYASLEDDVFEFIFDIKGIPRPELSYYKVTLIIYVFCS